MKEIKHPILAFIISVAVPFATFAQDFMDTTLTNFSINQFDFKKGDSFDFRRCKFIDWTILGSLSFDKGEELLMIDSKVTGGMKVSFTFPLVRIFSDTIDHLHIEIGDLLDFEKRKFLRPHDSIDLAIKSSVINELSMISTNIKDFYFLENRGLKKMYLSEVDFIGSITLKDFELPDTLIIDDVNFSKATDELNLTNHLNNSPKKICALMIRNTDCNKINLNYSRFHLCFADSTNDDERASVYQQLLNNFKIRGKMDSYEKLDKEFKEFSYIKDSQFLGWVKNFADKHWWDYGYNKIQVVWNSFLIFGLFALINLLAVGYDKLLTKGYSINKFVNINRIHKRKYAASKQKRNFLKILYGILYSGFVFWGWKLDLTNLNIKRIDLFLYILFQYSIGVICLACIANYFITR